MKVDGKVEMTVDGTRWRAVTSLDECGPDDPCFVLRVANDGSATVHFGDGERGRRPPRGASIESTYRPGGGQAGHTPSKDPLRALLDLIAEMADQVSHDLEQIYADAFIETADGRMRLDDITDLRTVISDHRVEFVVRLKRRPRHRPKPRVAT
jgi:hypothetical protein